MQSYLFYINMMNIKKTVVIILCFCSAVSLCFAESETKKVLFLAGVPSHKKGEHEYRAGSILLAKALNKSGLDIEAKVHWYGWPKDENIFEDVDVCVVYADQGGARSNKKKGYQGFTEKNYAFLNQKVKQGMGIMFIHYGVHPAEAIGEQYFMDWIGGYFNNSQSINSHWVADLKAKQGHPVSNGIDNPVRAHDEFYFNIKMASSHDDKSCSDCYALVTDTPTIEKITKLGSKQFQTQAAADAFNTQQAIMWCRDSDNQGRGVGFSGGHFHHNWAIEGMSKMVLNAIVWIARMEVPEQGVKFTPVTVEQLNENLDPTPPERPLKLPDPSTIEYVIPQDFLNKINK